MKFQVKSVNISEKKGTVKKPVGAITLTETGIKGDAHAGTWHRQVSLLGTESIKKASDQADRKFNFGDFAENITTEGFEIYKTNIFDRFICKDIILEVAQIGKKCHKGCEVMTISGKCIMPLEGIFCRVISGGEIKEGDEFMYKPKELKVSIITLSDRAYRGEYQDKSGPHIKHKLQAYFKEYNRKANYNITIIPDDKTLLEKTIKGALAENSEIIFTTGGTGIGSRDITPDVIKPLLSKEVSGIMDLVRIKYGMDNPNVALSRSIAGTIDTTLVYVLPGSTKAVIEYLTEILPTIEHSLRMINNIDDHS